MALTDAQRIAVQRIVARLRSDDPTAYRAGGRSVAHQCIAHRGEMVRALRGEMSELGEHAADERRRGYQEALEDVLLAAEAAIEPREQELRARHELAAAPALQAVLDHVAAAPLTPSEAAKRIDKSAATGTRIFERLRALDLLAELPSVDGRERPHRVTVLGARLARTPEPRSVRTPVPRPSRPWRTPVPIPIAAAGASDHDALTGTLRPDAFLRILERELELHRKASAEMCVMRVDIADYAALEATSSFAAVEDLVVQVASTLKDELGAAARIGRYEVDKFMVMLPQAAPAEATDRASALLAKLASPVNIGIAGTDAAGKVDDILARSQISLELAKDSGPGTVKTWSRPAMAAGKPIKPR